MSDRPRDELKAELSGPTAIEVAYGPIRLNLVEGWAKVSGTVVDLQPKQLHTLAYLIHCAGRAVTSRELAARVFQTHHAPGSSKTRRQIMELRRRLGAAGSLIVTTPDGYALVAIEAASVERLESDGA